MGADLTQSLHDLIARFEARDLSHTLEAYWRHGSTTTTPRDPIRRWDG